MYANKLATTRHAIENKNTSHSQVLAPGASRNPPDPNEHFLFCSFVAEGTHGSFESTHEQETQRRGKRALIQRTGKPCHKYGKPCMV
eukprot:936727-Pelagomonas_calceolata.AAC.1